MRKKFSIIVLLALVMSVGAPTVSTYPLESTFRAYLDRRFWQPFAKFVADLGRDLPPRREQADRPFAGMADLTAVNGAKTALRAVRDAYRPLSRSDDYVPPKPLEEVSELCAHARAAVTAALQADLTEEESEELRLVEAKIDMREGEAGNREALQRAREQLQTFLGTARTPALASEARGWLARVHYLLGESASAAKIYLDELAVADSVLTRNTLLTSLRLIFSSDESKTRLADHLGEYFDTPAHALFVVNLLTNPSYQEGRPAMAAVATQAIASLQKHKELFHAGPESEALTLALMRAALYMGDPGAALAYSRLVPRTSATADSPEFNWMTAACHFLRGEYVAAEAPLLRMYRSNQADDRDRAAAAQALLGVYQKLGRSVDQLHAAFLYYYYPLRSTYPSTEDNVVFSRPYDGWLLDLPYLLDVQLTDQELRAYLKRYPQSDGPVFPTGQSRSLSASEIVEYALAVRYARREEYQQAAAIYQRLGSWPRVHLMQKLAQLRAVATDPARTGRQRLEARYAYAAFLTDHPNQIFFNDTLWQGFQTEVFIEQYRDHLSGMHTPPAQQGLTRQEREFFLRRERRLRDEQEERWRAYKILAAVVDEAGPSELGRRAARKALDCLVRINTERFDRKEEIAAAMRRLANWLRKHSVQHARVQDSPGDSETRQGCSLEGRGFSVPLPGPVGERDGFFGTGESVIRALAARSTRPPSRKCSEWCRSR